MTTPAAPLRILEAIRELTRANGYPPSIRDLQETCGLARGVVQKHLARLVEDGLIRRDPGVARGIVLLDPDSTEETP